MAAALAALSRLTALACPPNVCDEDGLQTGARHRAAAATARRVPHVLVPRGGAAQPPGADGEPAHLLAHTGPKDDEGLQGGPPAGGRGLDRPMAECLRLSSEREEGGGVQRAEDDGGRQTRKKATFWALLANE